MRIDYAPQFRKAYNKLPPKIIQKLRKQVGLLAKDLRHPSLHAKKYDEKDDIWQARVDSSWRLYFMIRNDTYYLLDIISHPK